MKHKLQLILVFLVFSISFYGHKPVYRDSLFLSKSELLTPSGTNLPNVVPSYKLTHEWQRHKTFQTLGWTALGTGTTLMIVGAGGSYFKNEESTLFYSLFYSGIAVTSSSIPLFVYSIKNKQKALNEETGSGYKQTVRWKRHKTLQTLGWVTWGTGTTLMLVGFIGQEIETKPYKPVNHYYFRRLGYVGVGLTAASIPLFAFSIKDENRAHALSIGSCSLTKPLRNGAGIAYTPGVSLGFNF